VYLEGLQGFLSIPTSSNQFRRTPLVSSGASAASQNSHSYLATQASSADTQDATGGSSSSMSTPARVNGNTVLLTHHPDMKDFGVQNVATMRDFGVQNVAAMTAVGTAMTPDWVGTLQQGATFMTVPSKAWDNLVVLLSNAEQALRRSSGTNAPLRCWGCQGIHEDDQHLYRDCPRQLHENIQANFKKNLDAYVAKKRAFEQKQKFDPNNWKKDGFASPRATSLFNGILDATNATSRQHLVAEFVYEHNSKSDVSVEQSIGRLRKHARVDSPGGDEEEGGGPPLALPFWVVQDQQNDYSSWSFSTAPFSPSVYQFEAQRSSSDLCYPIALELPHVVIPVGRKGEATIEGLLDTGGACTMGDLVYWQEVAGGCPHLISQFKELSNHQEKPISIGGVGAGKVEITHIIV
jgi:hypothetical protein